MRVVLLALFALSLTSGGASAQTGTWETGSVRGTAFAATSEGPVALSFQCVDGKDLVFGFFMPPAVAHADVSGLERVGLSMAPDRRQLGDGASRGRVWSVDPQPITRAVGAFGVAFSGQAAVEWGRIARRANRTIEVAFKVDAGDGGTISYNATTFTAKGSTAAVRSVMDACGV